jgi:hypothetical protein
LGIRDQGSVGFGIRDQGFAIQPESLTLLAKLVEAEIPD